MKVARAALAACVALCPTRAFAPQDEQARFAEEALAAVAVEDDVLLGALVREQPHRARLLGHELLWEALRAGSADARPLAAARRLAGVLEAERLAPVERDLGAAVARLATLDADQRARQRELDRAFFAAMAALARGERDAAGRDAALAAEGARALELPYLEMRARRLAAECLRNGDGLRDALLRVTELERALGLWSEEVADLEALAEVELQEGRLAEAEGRLERAAKLARGIGAEERAIELAGRRGAVLANLGRFEAAHELLSTALAHFEARGRAAEAVETSMLLGELASGAGDYEEALARFAGARRTARAAGDARGEARAATRLAGAHSELGRVADAEDALEGARALVQRADLALERKHWILARGLVQLDAGAARQALAALASLEIGRASCRARV